AWIEAALHKIRVTGKWMYVVWMLSFIGFLLMIFFGSDAVRRRAAEVYLVPSLGLLAAAVALMAIGRLLAFVAWWLRTWRNERLRPALVFLSGHFPWLAGTGTYICLVVYLEDRLTWPHFLASACHDVRNMYRVVSLGIFRDRAHPPTG